MKSPDSVTVLVFKDNYASRSFQVPLKWFSRLGMVLGALIGAVLITGFFALKFYRVARHGGVNEMAPPAPAPVVATAPAAPNNAPAAPVPTVTVTMAVAANLPYVQAPSPVKDLTAPAPAPGAKTPAVDGLIFGALPAGTKTQDPNKIPIAIKNPVFSWNAGGRKLTVKFDVQYVSEDKGTQQGRIILLARGPETVFAYPNGVLNKGQSPALINPEEGEFFSVSRLRNTVADFGPLPARTSVTEIEAIILGSDGRLLIHEVLPIELPKQSPSSAKAKPVEVPPQNAAPAAPPAPDAKTTAPNKHLEPGYDQ